jgi:hypothetical protein
MYWHGLQADFSREWSNQVIENNLSVQPEQHSEKSVAERGPPPSYLVAKRKSECKPNAPLFPKGEEMFRPRATTHSGNNLAGSLRTHVMR